MLARSVTLNVLGQVGVLVLGFVGTVVLARALGPSDRGLLGLMLSVAALGLAVGAAGVPFAVLFEASRADAPVRALLGNSLAYALGLGVVVVSAAWLLTDVVADAFGRGQGGEAWVLAAALIPLMFLDYTGHNQLLGQLRFGRFNALLVASRLALLAGIVVFVSVLGLGVTGGLLAAAAGSLLMIAGSLAVLLRAGRPRLDGPLMRRLLGYGVRVQGGTIFQMANQRLDVVILGFFAPLSAVGFYVVAQTVAELVVVLGRSFQSSVLPLVAHRAGQDDQNALSGLALRNHGLLAAVATVANAGVGTLLVLFAFGPSYHDALVPMLILLPGMWFLSTGVVIGGDLRGRGRPGAASALAGAALIVTIVLDVLLIPEFGVSGAAAASVVAYASYGILSLRTLSRVAGIPLRELTVPTREDLALYPAIVRSVIGRLRGQAPTPEAG